MSVVVRLNERRTVTEYLRWHAGCAACQPKLDAPKERLAVMSGVPITCVLVTTGHHAAERKQVLRISVEVLNDLGPLALLFRLIRILALSSDMLSVWHITSRIRRSAQRDQQAPRRRTPDNPHPGAVMDNLLKARVSRELRHGHTHAHDTSRTHRRTSWSNPKRRVVCFSRVQRACAT